MSPATTVSRRWPALPAACWAPWAVLMMVLVSSALAPGPALGQAAPSFSLAEIRKIQTLRDLRETGAPKDVARATAEYLEQFPDGRYRDEALVAQGEAHARLGAPAAALEAFERLITSFADSAFREQAMMAAVTIHRGQGNEAGAAAMAARLLEEYPESVFRGRIHFWVGRGAFQAGRFQEASGHFGRIESERGFTDGERSEFYHLAGWSHVEAGHPEQAWPFFSRYAELRVDGAGDPAVLLRMAEAMEKGRRPREALLLFDALINRHPLVPAAAEARFRRAELFATAIIPSAGGAEERQQALNEGIAHYDALLAMGKTPYLAQGLEGRARLLVEAGRDARALEDYTALAKASEARANDLELLASRVNLMLGLERKVEAIQLLTWAIDNQAIPRRQKSGFVVQRATLYYERDDCGRVLSGLDPLPVFSDPEQRRRAFFLRGTCLYQQGEWENASWDLEVVVNEPEYLTPVWPVLADAYERSSQHSRLVNLGERLLSTKQVEPSEDLFRRLGKAYELLGQPDMMIATYDRLGSLNPEAVRGAEVRLRLGRAHEAIGRDDRAEAHYLAVVTGNEVVGQVSDAAYLSALGRLQGFYLRRNAHQPLVKLNRDAEARLRGRPEGEQAAAWLTTSLLGWGRAALQNGDATIARAALEEGVGRMGAAPPAERLEAVMQLVDAYRRTNGYTQAEALLTRETQAATDPPQRLRVQAMLGGLYLDWAQSREPVDPPAATLRRYQQAVRHLPETMWRERYAAALKLDAHYESQGTFKERVELFGALAPTIPDAEVAEKLRVYRARLYADWSRAETAQGRADAGMAISREGEKLLKPGEWRARYEFVAARGEVYLRKEDYTTLVLEYEEVLPELEEDALRARVEGFLGQVHLTWAQAARKEQNAKSIRIRAYRALDYLPPGDWERRLAATNLLADVLEQEQKSTEAAELYERLMPQLPAGELRRKYALYLGRFYLERLKQPDQARPWLAQGDGGGNDPLSLEAGYLLATLDWEQNRAEAALTILESLAARGLDQSKWLIPIRSRLAVIHHQRKSMREALKNYEAVAAVTSPAMRDLYPRSIQLAEEQVRAIREYLRFRGGDGGKEVSVPTVRQ